MKSLRTRILVGGLLVVVMALGAVGVATYALTDRSLEQRVDKELASVGPVRAFPGARVLAQADAIQRGIPFLEDSLIEIRAPDGSVVARLPDTGAPVELRGALANPPANGQAGPVTISRDGQQFRVVSARADSGELIIIGRSLAANEATLRELLFVEMLVGAITVLAVSLLLWVIIRRETAPLEHIAETADAISAGNLSDRVDIDDARTEVGRVGHSLNAMLGRIEVAVDERARSEERLRDFVADASHELRTPLTSIRGYAELFFRGARDEPKDLDVAMTRIHEEAIRLGGLVDDLLLLARLDREPVAMRDKVDLAAVARDAVLDARAAEPDREINLDAPATILVVGDRGRLQQAVANLLANVRVHAGPDVDAHVSVRAHAGSALIEVRDKGQGMDTDRAERVFERFFRVDAARARDRGGSGLGLAIVRAIAHAHAGTVEVETAPGQGFTVTLRLPAIAGPGAQTAPPSAGEMSEVGTLPT
jgi:two-component system, OmpR family, sensor kinase